MAFKMKAGKEGPMRKNFPAAFKQDLEEMGRRAARQQSDEILKVKMEDTKRRNEEKIKEITARMKMLESLIERKKKMGVDFSKPMKELSELEDKLQNVKKPN
jgi:seryl-tRNA synthetase|tara:strand:- start:63 stop:368 length:306 start_codon:yes stop_codon:yes gene_type:complete